MDIISVTDTPVLVRALSELTALYLDSWKTHHLPSNGHSQIVTQQSRLFECYCGIEEMLWFMMGLTTEGVNCYSVT